MLADMLGRRLLLGAVTLFFTLTLVFVIIRMVPSDPATVLMMGEATPEQLDRLRELWGLDKSIVEQFFIYLANLVQGNAGDSYQFQRVAGMPGVPVFDLVMNRLPATGYLALVAIIFSMLIALPLGILAALFPDSILDKLVLILASVLASVPAFFSGMLLMLFFSLTLRILPTGGYDSPQSVILPALALSFSFSAVLLRVTRTEMARIMRSEFIQSARAKGLRSWRIVLVHALKNAMIPLLTIIGLRFGDLLAGSVVVETLFRWPGIGGLMIDSIIARDYPVVQLVIPLAALAFIIVNITVDVLFGALDPRLRTGGRS
ncbi:ABC transporter permease [Phaeobacter sp. J2-8]|uniref:ABC transporter permease n=1 Tax=Phaeobacter sp. J2-8 TaxID=2931394 RepID=UPI001FD139CE|nr:ABC transporter permease [Phaeobacter sp. J2-8]MCJ7873373.1 ABC transporter permease [Phaeobacter sp. J2-8]